MDVKQLPARPNLEQYRTQAKDLVKSRERKETDALQRIRLHYSRLRVLSDADFENAEFVLADAQFVIAREYGFESWPKFSKHIEATQRDNSPISNFESAVDAIITGDLAQLSALLKLDPNLILARSTRLHRATLLHYVSANGVEDYRQKTPPNIIDVTKALLAAGAEVDATAEMYGSGATPLGLTASSIHPLRAGVQDALLETLLDAGAAVDGRSDGWEPLVAALDNGCPEAAATLARRGARINHIAKAAGLGQLERMKQFINPDGSLKPSAAVRGIPNNATAQLERAFIWACRYGHASVVALLLQMGVDVATKGSAGLTGLHWATERGSLEVIRTLLAHGAPLEIKNNFGGTVLGQTLWFALNGPHAGVDYPAMLALLIAAGAHVPATLTPQAQHLIDAANALNA